MTAWELGNSQAMNPLPPPADSVRVSQKCSGGNSGNW
jgi:hypothetical protein